MDCIRLSMYNWVVKLWSKEMEWRDARKINVRELWKL